MTFKGKNVLFALYIGSMLMPPGGKRTAKIAIFRLGSVLVEILMPVLKPVLITVGLFTFIISWNDVLGLVIYLSDSARYTISLGLSIFKGGYGTNWVAIMCASTLAVIPALLMYIIGQTYFVEGIVLSGLKN